ncbi:MAG: DNA polymerase III subunit chi [Betaproteobacteria bacterium HGW-Betaproteobacteria-9]|jgi:DNA polymerase-3 subunit chi|nr:MAG: DNA polymerase III subunit chi [Betaproteobacteria bacterium HGW-Betaproteobacteria-9]
MTEVAFHFNAPDKLGYACRLLRKAYLKGARVVVLGSSRDCASLDQALWTMAAGEFVPHCRESDAALLFKASPILIASGHAPPADFPADVLLNLSDECPVGFERFERLIEVVTFDEADRQRARERWKHYKAAGCEPLRHDLKIAGSAS